MKKRAILPLPQLIAPGRWRIKGDNNINLTAVEDKKMIVDLADNPHAESRRAREMAKARFSPDKFKHTSTVEASENARISRLLDRLGIESITKEYSFPYTPRSVKDLGCLYVELSNSKYHTKTLKEIISAIDQAPNAVQSIDLIINAVKAINDDPNTFESTKKAAALLDQLNGYTLDFSQLLMPSEELANEPDREGTEDKEGRVTWGEMIIDKPKLSQVRRPKGLQKHIATDMGTALTFPHRYITDRQVFGMRRKRAGSRVKGTVLLDVSGSMQITPDQIRELALIMPAATVAIYAGLAPDNTTGYLRIIASYGRISPILHHELHSGANVVDGPALDWLRRQSHPRIWVSDGHVRGQQDMHDPHLVYECQELMTRGKILRYWNLETVIAEIKRNKFGERAVNSID